MSINTNNQTIPQFSDIVLCTYSEQPVPAYVNQIIIDESTYEPVAFNHIINENKNAQLFGFLSRNDSFVNEQSFQEIIKCFEEHLYINFVYADKLLNDNIKVFLPSMPYDNSIIDTPVFLKQPLFKFNEQPKNIYFDSMIKNMFQTSLGYHIPKCIIKSKAGLINE